MTAIPDFPMPALSFDFSRGWAVAPFLITNCAHYFEDAGLSTPPLSGTRFRTYRAVCDLEAEVSESVPLIEPGDLPRCRHCVKKLERRHD